MNLCIRHADILTPIDFIKDGTILLQDGTIEWVGASSALEPPSGCLVYEAPGNLLTPGWIDMQINGAFGWDFTSQPESIWDVARQLPRYGVTSFLPTIITSPLDTINRAQHTLANSPMDFVGAVPLGLHVEGPFINSRRAGAHNVNHILYPDTKLVQGWSAENGIRMVTLAPELPGAIEMIHTLANNDVIVSAGHSLASLEESQRGFEAGISCGTHLFNAMPPLNHRNPGLVTALLVRRETCFGMIVDGIHIHPEVVSLAWQLGKAQRVYLVTDAIAALGMPPGEYMLGDMKVLVDNISVRLPDGSLAGSILHMDQAIRNLIQFTGCTLQDAICSVTDTPANLLGEKGRSGRIISGERGDLVLLTADLQVAMTFVSGKLAFRNNDLLKITEHIQ